MSEEKVVMYDSPEAATRVDMPGWKSRLGHFYPGDNPSSEHGARWSGCTHMTCECGKVFEKGHTICSSCEAKRRTDKYYALPLVDWDGVTPLCVWDDDRYFFDEDSVLDYMADLKADDPEADHEVQLVLCTPHKLHLLDADTWCDDLAEDGELPDDVLEKLDALNEALKNAPTVCWSDGRQRIDVDALWKQLADDEQKEISKASEPLDFGVTAYDPETGCRPNSDMNEDGTVKIEVSDVEVQS